jgi:hypothetical protein
MQTLFSKKIDVQISQASDQCRLTSSELSLAAIQTPKSTIDICSVLLYDLVD